MTRTASGRPTVVVGVDGSTCSKVAVAWATEYAKRHGSDLALVSAWHWPTSFGGPIAFDGFDPEEDARKAVEAAAADVDLPLQRIHAVVEHGAPGAVLVAASEPAELLVVGTRGHGTLAGVLLGSTSDYCVHHAPCPVVVVR